MHGSHPLRNLEGLVVDCLSQLTDARTPAGKPATVCDLGYKAAGKTVLPYIHKIYTYIYIHAYIYAHTYIVLQILCGYTYITNDEYLNLCYIGNKYIDALLCMCVCIYMYLQYNHMCLSFISPLSLPPIPVSLDYNLCGSDAMPVLVYLVLRRKWG